MRNRVFLLAPVVAALASFVSCTTAGSSTDTTSGDGGAGTVGTQESEAAGDDESWTGYVEDYSFPSGSSDLALTFTRNADGSVTGHAVFGDLPFYAPPTDPSVGYPLPTLRADGSEPSGQTGDVEGFRYTLLNGSADGMRLRATVDSNELYAGWCPLETPFADSLWPGKYYCAPVDYEENQPLTVPPTCSYTSGSGVTIPIDCARAYLCTIGSVCACTSASCSYVADYFPQLSFDFQIEDTQVSGSLVIPPGDTNYNIHLTRQ